MSETVANPNRDQYENPTKFAEVNTFVALMKANNFPNHNNSLYAIGAVLYDKEPAFFKTLTTSPQGVTPKQLADKIGEYFPNA